MTLLAIQRAVAAYLEKVPADLTVNGEDLFLNAINQSRREAELAYDFEFTRKLVDLTVNGVTGGSLEDVQDYVTDAEVEIKSILEVGLFDTDGNLRPVEWTTVAEGLERQRIDNPRTSPRYPTDAWYSSGVVGRERFEFSGDKVFRWPKDSANNFTLGMEVYSFTADWTSNPQTVTVSGATPASANDTYFRYGAYRNKTLYINQQDATTPTGVVYAIWHTGTYWVVTVIEDFGKTSLSNYARLTSTSESPAGTYTPQGTWSGTIVVAESTNDVSEDVWLKHGAQYLQWQTIVHLNHLFKGFVFRQEGNLPPPEALAQRGLQALKDWDVFKFEQFRRHGR